MQNKKTNLIADAQQGDLVAFRELIDQHSSRVYSIAYQVTGNSADAQDIAQEVFIKLYGKLHKFDHKYRFTTWLYRMAINTSIDHQRKQTSKNELPLNEIKNLFLLDEGQNSPDVVHERNELSGIVSRLTGLLTKKQRRVFVLRDLQNFSTPEIARILNCSQITIRVHLTGARSRIRNALRKYYPEYVECNPSRKGGNK